MRAVIARDFAPVIVDLPTPEPGPDELLVNVRATALNRADVLQVRGKYPPPPGAPDTLGLEFAGDVLQVGENVTNFAPGDRVMALVAGGAYAEQAVVHAGHAIPIPKDFTYEEAAAIPEAFVTAYSNLLLIGGLRESQRVLIHAGASGVGLAATQIAKLVGAQVFVTASASKHDACRAAGADMTIDYQTENFAARILSEYPGVALVLDTVGAPYWEDNLRVLEKWGRLVIIGLQGGSSRTVNFGTIMRKRLTITGSTLRDRSKERKTNLIVDFAAWAMPHFTARTLRPTVWRVMTLDEVETAHQLMKDNANAGKIVLRV